MRHNIIHSLFYGVFSIAIMTICSAEILFAESTQLELQAGLQVQLFPMQTTITDDEEIPIIINIKNDNDSPVTDITITPHIIGLTFRWPDSSLNTVIQLQPHTYRNIEILLRRQEGRMRHDINAVFEVRYSIINSGEKYHGQLFRTLPLRVDSIENTNISGIPLYFASYIIPGLFTIIVLGCFVSPLPEVLKDNKYLVAIPLSVLQIWLLRYILTIFSYKFGDTMRDFIYYASSGAVFAVPIGYTWQYILFYRLPNYDKYPADEKMSIGELLARYVEQTRTIDVIRTSVDTDNGKYVGLMVKTRGAKKAILLPVQYKLTIDDDINKKEFKESLAAKDIADIAKHLRCLSDNKIEVVGEIKLRNGNVEEMFEGGKKQMTFQIDNMKYTEVKEDETIVYIKE